MWPLEIFGFKANRGNHNEPIDPVMQEYLAKFPLKRGKKGYPMSCPGEWRMCEVCFDCVKETPRIICPTKKDDRIKETIDGGYYDPEGRRMLEHRPGGGMEKSTRKNGRKKKVTTENP